MTKDIKQTRAIINGLLIDARGRREDDRWALLVYTPTLSIRSAQSDMPKVLELVTHALTTAIVLATVSDGKPISHESTAYQEVLDQVERTLKVVMP